MRAVYWPPTEASGGLALCGPSVTLLLGGDLTGLDIDRYWTTANETAGLKPLLRLLADDTSVVPRPFAIAAFERSTTRVFVGGLAVAKVSSALGDEVFSGKGLTTWSEQVVTEAIHVTLALLDVPRRADVVVLPLERGVVLAEGVELEPEASPIDAASLKTDASYAHLFGETIVRPWGDHVGDTQPSDIVRLLREQRRKRKHQNTERLQPVLKLADGTTVPIDDRVIVGRAPVARDGDSASARLLRLDSPSQDISRSHAEFSMVGETVMVTDLHSSNGTVVALPNRKPQRLRAGEATPILVGTIVDFGDGVAVTVDEQ